MKRLFISLLITLLLRSVTAQDPQFSQFYSVPLYLAPSFAGLTEDHRLNVNYRNQWPSIPGAFVTVAAAYDRNFDTYNSGVGILFLRDQAGSGRLTSTSAALQYSYEVKINPIFALRPALQFSYTQRSLDFFRLTFNDQLGPGGVTNPTTIEVPSIPNIGYIDVGTSLMSYTETMWFGVSIDHLLRPNQSLYEWDGDKVARLPMKTTVFGGVKLVKYGQLLRPLAESLQFAFSFRSQGKFQQLDLGMYWQKSPLVLGLWYRDIPLFTKKNRDAIIFLVGWKTPDFNIAYSYDFSISRLITSTGGSHEIGLTYTWNSPQRTKKPRMVPCPDF